MNIKGLGDFKKEGILNSIFQIKIKRKILNLTQADKKAEWQL